MAKSSDSNSREESFDLDRFRKLLQLMEKYGVNEVALQNEGESWKIRRGPRQVAVAPEQVVQAAAPAPVVAPAAAPVPAAAAPSAPEAVTINAPTIGTFYSAPPPEDSELVSVGSVV
ncbi:MAG: acetyl-CoA carboxylase, biotin carboxyl carrier protein, partial [Planctomycetaceae bacterium]